MVARMFRWNGEQVKERLCADHDDRRFVALSMYHEYMGDPGWRLRATALQDGPDGGFRVNDQMTVRFS